MTTGREHPVRSISLIAGLCVISSPITGSALTVPIVVIAVLSVAAAVIDLRTQRIPNSIVVAGLASIAVGALVSALIDAGRIVELCAAAGLGALLGGAPLMFLLWLIRPTSVGGGDWKLLTCQSAAVGLVAPLAAPIILFVAAPVQVVHHRLLRRPADGLPLGPALAAGYVAAVVAGLAFRHVLNGAAS